MESYGKYEVFSVWFPKNTPIPRKNRVRNGYMRIYSPDYSLYLYKKAKMEYLYQRK